MEIQSTYAFREMDVEEAPRMFRMVEERIAWMDREGIRSWNTSDYLELYPLTYYEDRARSRRMFALERLSDGKIVCAGVLLEEDGRWPDGLPAVYIHHLVSDAGERGTGSVFLACAEDYARARGVDRIRLDCYTHNAEINAYYEKLGYRPAGTCVDGEYQGTLREKRLRTGMEEKAVYEEFMRLAGERFSVRKFDGRAVEPEVVDQILQAGRLAPTACNRQPQRIAVVSSPEGLEKLRRCTECHFGAPAALLVCHDREACWKRSYDGASSGGIDAAIVTTHMMLAAAALGVGTTWVMHFDPEAVRREFAVPENLEPTALLVMGYPAPDAAPYPGHLERKPMEAVISYNGF